MVVRPKKDERKKSKASEQLGRPVHHNKENQRPGLPHPAVSKKQAEGGPSGKARKMYLSTVEPRLSVLHGIGSNGKLKSTDNPNIYFLHIPDKIQRT
ncbi:hypothetical protein NQ318_021636 [Aromia moschata]|uniref:Uncharacterized protein n=1 Tax=Aromia moschata TaxID=1265417 RepID=A0AAV8X5J1_9CUCU|nr:hypothetical protein NQ318_021636 [Aromia moschata]